MRHFPQTRFIFIVCKNLGLWKVSHLDSDQPLFTMYGSVPLALTTLFYDPWVHSYQWLVAGP